MAMLPRAYRRPLAEGKQRVQRKLRNIEDEKADIIKLINAYTAKIERVAKTLLQADRECFFSFYHAVNRELEECLDKLFLIKAQLLENEEVGEILKDSGLVLEEKDSGGAAGGELTPFLPGEEEELSRCSSISKLCQSITSSMMLHDNKDFAGQSTSERNLTPHRDGSLRSDATVAAAKGPSYPPPHHVTGNVRSNSMMDTEPFDLSHVLHKWQNCDLQQNGVRRNSKAYSDGEDSRSEMRHHTAHAPRQQPPGGMSAVSLETSRIVGAPHSSTCSPTESTRQLSEFLEFSGRGPSSMPPLHSPRLANKLSDRHLEEACLAHKSQDMAMSAMEMKVREMQFWPKKDPLDSLAENHLPPPPPAPSESQNMASWISPPWTSGNRSREHTPSPCTAIKLSDPKQQSHVSLSRVSPVREIPDQVVLSARLSPPPQRAYQEVGPPEDFRPAVPPVDYDAYPEHYGASVVYEIPPPLLKLGMVTPVTVTHIIKPSDFWLRVLSEDGKELSEKLQLAYSSRHARENLRVEVGLYYCAPYGKDNTWHRVKVLGIHQAENGGIADVHVLFVDYGNTDMIPMTHLKSLDLNFTTWPLQAVHCCLNGLGVERQTWTSYEMAQFQQLVTSTELSAMFHEPRPDGVYPVDLWSNFSYGEEVLQESIVRLLVSSHSSLAAPPGMDNMNNMPELDHPDDKSPDKTPEVLSRNIVKEDSSEDENLEYYSDTSDTYVELNDYNVTVPPPLVKPSDGYLLGMVSVVIDPNEIYIHLITPNSSQLDDLREQMANYYNSENARDVVPLLALQRGSFWACRYTADQFWYRARVIDLPEERITVTSKVVIQYIDFGNKEELTVKDLRPLTAEFAKIPAFAIRCSLAYLKPKEDEDVEGGGWSQRVEERLSQLIDGEKCVTAQPVCDIENSDLWESSIDVLLWDSQDSKDVLLNKVLVREGLCDTEMSEWLEDDEKGEKEDTEDREEAEGDQEAEISVPPSGAGRVVKEEEGNFGLKFNLKDRLSPLADMDALLDNWNPLEEEYKSDRNSYAVDLDDIAVSTLGYKLEEDTKVCHYYSIRMRCPKGDNCPFLHVYNGRGIPAAKEEEIISGTTLKLPKPGGLFLVTVTSVDNPGHFYVVFPYGFFRLEDLFPSEDSSPPPPSKDQIDLKKLIHAIGKHYSKPGLHENTPISPALGSLVAARNTLGDGHWFRGRVTDAKQTDDTFVISVFCVDTGKTYGVPRRDVYKILPEFLHVPFQAVECFLANVEPKGSETGGKWSKEAKETFLDMVSDKTMVARILNRDSEALYIDLVDIDQQQEFSVNGHLVTMGFAQFSKSMTCIPPPQDSQDDKK